MFIVRTKHTNLETDLINIHPRVTTEVGAKNGSVEFKMEVTLGACRTIIFRIQKDPTSRDADAQ